MKPIRKINLLLIAGIILSLLAACATSPESGADAGGNGTIAMVDGVTVEQRDNHFYAVVNGFYPDPCTYISTVQQVVEADTISITLLTERPADLLCAAMLTPYSVDILLTIGGLMPQEYSVVVNEGPSTTFSLE